MVGGAHRGLDNPIEVRVGWGGGQVCERGA